MPIVGFISDIGPTELGLVLVLVLILFGAGRLPQVFEQFGKALKSFRDAQKDESIDVTSPRKEITGEPVSDVSDAQEPDKVSADASPGRPAS